jgi:glycerophosphoryl diester phosphodiesterase
MMDFLIVLVDTLALFFAILVVLYLFLLVRPKKRKNGVEKFLTDYAHRGLHGGEIPENSLSAFKKAIDEGVGIELDVQLSKDGVVMVFHDYTLKRMTGVEKLLSDLDFSELSKLTLLKTEEKIPTLEEVLSLVDGKVPLLVELKGENLDSSLCGKTAEVLKNYKGDFCIESFNPLLIKKMKSFLPDAFYGQLYTNVCRDKKKYSPLNIILSLMALNVVSRPDFIAYNKLDRNSFPVKLTTKFYKAYNFVWTTKTKEEFDTAKALGECPIFEKEA